MAEQAAGPSSSSSSTADGGVALGRTHSQQQWLGFIDGMDDLGIALAQCVRLHINLSGLVDVDALDDLVSRLLAAVAGDGGGGSLAAASVHDLGALIERCEDEELAAAAREFQGSALAAVKLRLRSLFAADSGRGRARRTAGRAVVTAMLGAPQEAESLLRADDQLPPPSSEQPQGADNDRILQLVTAGSMTADPGLPPWSTLAPNSEIQQGYFTVVNEGGQSKYAQLLSDVKHATPEFPFGSVVVEWLQPPQRSPKLKLGTGCSLQGQQNQLLSPEDAQKFEDYLRASIGVPAQQHTGTQAAPGSGTDKLERIPSIVRSVPGQFEFDVVFNPGILFDGEKGEVEARFIFQRGDNATAAAVRFVAGKVAPAGAELRDYLPLVMQIVQFIRSHCGGEIGVENILSGQVWANIEECCRQCIMSAALSFEDFEAYERAYEFLTRKEFADAVCALEEAILASQTLPEERAAREEQIQGALEHSCPSIALIPVVKRVRELANGTMHDLRATAFERLTRAARDTLYASSIDCEQGELLIRQMLNLSTTLSKSEASHCDQLRQSFQQCRLAITALTLGFDRHYVQAMKMLADAIDLITERGCGPTQRQLKNLTLKVLKTKARSMGVTHAQIDGLDDYMDPRTAAVELILQISSGAQRPPLSDEDIFHCKYLTSYLKIVERWAVQAVRDQIKPAEAQLVKWMRDPNGTHPLVQYEHIQILVQGILAVQPPCSLPRGLPQLKTLQAILLKTNATICYIKGKLLVKEAQGQDATAIGAFSLYRAATNSFRAGLAELAAAEPVDSTDSINVLYRHINHELQGVQPRQAHIVKEELRRLEILGMRQWNTTDAAQWVWLCCVHVGTSQLKDADEVTRIFVSNDIDGDELATLTRKAVRRLLQGVISEISERENAASLIFDKLRTFQTVQPMPVTEPEREVEPEQTEPIPTAEGIASQLPQLTVQPIPVAPASADPSAAEQELARVIALLAQTEARLAAEVAAREAVEAEVAPPSRPAAEEGFPPQRRGVPQPPQQGPVTSALVPDVEPEPERELEPEPALPPEAAAVVSNPHFQGPGGPGHVVIDLLPAGPIDHLQVATTVDAGPRQPLSASAESDLAAFVQARLEAIANERAALLRRKAVLEGQLQPGQGQAHGSQAHGSQPLGGQVLEVQIHDEVLHGDSKLLAELVEIDRRLAALGAEEVELRQRELLVAELYRNGVSVEQVMTAREQHIPRIRGSSDSGAATDNELMAAHAYTLAGPPLYQWLNEQLWSKCPNMARYEHMYKYLIEAVKHIRGTDQMCYRGQPSLYGMAPEDLDVGQQMMWRGFTSVSTSEGVARNFASISHGTHPIVYVIRGLQPFASAKLKLVSQFMTEEEVVLPPGVVFVVTARSQIRGVDTVELNFKGIIPQATKRFRWQVQRTVEFREQGTLDVNIVARNAADAADLWRGREKELLEGGRVAWNGPTHVANGAGVVRGPVKEINP
jgi:hypothetical protein